MKYYKNPDTNEFRILNENENIVLKLLPGNRGSLKVGSGDLKTDTGDTQLYHPSHKERAYLNSMYRRTTKEVERKFLLRRKKGQLYEETT